MLLLGATGTIGRATARALVEHGHDVVCIVRPRPRAGFGDTLTNSEAARAFGGATARFCDVTDAASLERDGLCGEKFEAMVSCLASRTGVPRDAWAIDYHANVGALHVAQRAGVSQMVLLSAICVQRPLLAFQHAKLAFEQELVASGMTYSIVRATAFFKSLSGQVARVKGGRPFLVFGDGTLTACKPISDRDLAHYLVNCLDDESCNNRILPIGGPGPAITPRDQGNHLFALLGRKPMFREVPVALLGTVQRCLGAVGLLVPSMAAKAELARIGHYYATQSMLVLDPRTGRYDAAATPSTGSETLFDYYARLLRGEVAAERGDHSVF